MVDSIPPVNVGTVAIVKPLKNDEKKNPKKQKKEKKHDENPADNAEDSRIGVNIDERC